jgi:hypothetical protein
MGYAELAKAVFNLFSALFGYAGQRSTLYNTVEMKKAAQAQADADFRSKAEKAIANDDVETLRKLAAS